jgi:hypothetical protein
LANRGSFAQQYGSRNVLVLEHIAISKEHRSTTYKSKVLCDLGAKRTYTCN